MKGVAVNGEAIGRCMGELINALSVAHEQQVEPLDGTTSSWMRKMKELGVPENALPFFLAGAQTTVYSDGN